MTFNLNLKLQAASPGLAPSDSSYRYSIIIGIHLNLIRLFESGPEQLSPLGARQHS